MDTDSFHGELHMRIIWQITKFVAVTYLWWNFPLQMTLSIITLLGFMALLSSLPARRRASTLRARPLT